MSTEAGIASPVTLAALGTCVAYVAASCVLCAIGSAGVDTPRSTVPDVLFIFSLLAAMMSLEPADGRQVFSYAAAVTSAAAVLLKVFDHVVRERSAANRARDGVDPGVDVPALQVHD